MVWSCSYRHDFFGSASSVTHHGSLIITTRSGEWWRNGARLDESQGINSIHLVPGERDRSLYPSCWDTTMVRSLLIAHYCCRAGAEHPPQLVHPIIPRALLFTTSNYLTYNVSIYLARPIYTDFTHPREKDIDRVTARHVGRWSLCCTTASKTIFQTWKIVPSSHKHQTGTGASGGQSGQGE